MRELPNPTFALSSLFLPRGLQQRPVIYFKTPSQQSAPKPERGALVVSWAGHQDEVRQVQRLRYEVFAKEMGARPSQARGQHLQRSRIRPDPPAQSARPHG